MAKNNQYVGVDDKFVPEEEKRSYVQEPIIGSENVQKIRGAITGATSKMTSPEGKDKLAKGAKKALKIAKGVGIGYLVMWGFFILVFLVMLVFAIVFMSKSFSQQSEIMDTHDRMLDQQERMMEQWDN